MGPKWGDFCGHSLMAQNTFFHGKPDLLGNAVDNCLSKSGQYQCVFQ